MVDEWRDITKDFVIECSSLGDDELALAEDFRLSDGIASLEIGDLKMDSGMHLLQLKEQVVHAHELPTRAFSAADTALLIDYFVLNLFAWLFDGHPMTQTVQSCVCLRHPTKIGDPFVRLVSEAQLYVIGALRQVVVSAKVFQVEEFSYDQHDEMLLNSRVNLEATLEGLHDYIYRAQQCAASEFFACDGESVTKSSLVRSVVLPRIAFLASLVDFSAKAQSLIYVAEQLSCADEPYTQLKHALSKLIAQLGTSFATLHYPCADPRLFYHRHYSALVCPNQPPRLLGLLPLSQAVAKLRGGLSLALSFVSLFENLPLKSDECSAIKAVFSAAIQWSQATRGHSIPLLGRSMMHLLLFPKSLKASFIPFDKPASFDEGLGYHIDIVRRLFLRLFDRQQLQSSSTDPLVTQIEYYALFALHAVCRNKPKQQRIFKALARRIHDSPLPLTCQQFSASTSGKLKHQMAVAVIEMGFELELYSEMEAPVARMVLMLAQKLGDDLTFKKSDCFGDCRGVLDGFKVPKHSDSQNSESERTLHNLPELLPKSIFQRKFRPLTEIYPNLYTQLLKDERIRSKLQKNLVALNDQWASA